MQASLSNRVSLCVISLSLHSLVGYHQNPNGSNPKIHKGIVSFMIHNHDYNEYDSCITQSVFNSMIATSTPNQTNKKDKDHPINHYTEEVISKKIKHTRQKRKRFPHIKCLQQQKQTPKTVNHNNSTKSPHNP